MILFFTDSISTLNGMSVFSNYFISWLCEQYNEDIFVYEVKHMQFTHVKAVNMSRIIKRVYVNGHFSNSDNLIRNKNFFKIINENAFVLNVDCGITIISHGWPKVKNRFTSYNLAYNLKNIIRTINIDSILKHYTSIIFISDKFDDFRHYDYKWSVTNNFKSEYIDFKSEIRLQHPTLISGDLKNYILVISNLDTVKNLFLLVKMNFYNHIKGKKKKKYVLLTSKPKSLYDNILLKTLVISGATVIFDQTKKTNLIVNCDYLFIPSYTEYLPIVAFEAFSLNKNVVSYYFIIGLSDFKRYYFIKK